MVPAARPQSTLKDAPVGALSITEKVKLPLSLCETSAIVNAPRSSLVIVPVAVSVMTTAAFETVFNDTEKVSFASTLVSPLTVTVNVSDSPAVPAKVSVPAAAT